MMSMTHENRQMSFPKIDREDLNILKSQIDLELAKMRSMTPQEVAAAGARAVAEAKSAIGLVEEAAREAEEAEADADATQAFAAAATKMLRGRRMPKMIMSSESIARDENYRSDYVVRAMTCTECGKGRKLIFAPYAEGKHWMLGVINSAQSTVYWFDPAGSAEPRQFFVDTITQAFEKRNYIDSLAKYEAKDVVWKMIKAPMQPFGTVLCGYYICRYMLEIVRGRYVTITPNFMLRAPLTYSLEQIDEVRDIWANFALQFNSVMCDDEV